MCFPLASILAVLIWCVIIGAVLAILRLLIAFVLPRLGVGAAIISLFVQIFMIILWAVITIAVIVVVGDVIMCLIGMAPSIGHIGR
jgi:hypothetical protein